MRTYANRRGVPTEHAETRKQGYVNLHIRVKQPPRSQDVPMARAETKGLENACPDSTKNNTANNMENKAFQYYYHQAPDKGLEPLTTRLKVWRSTN